MKNYVVVRKIETVAVVSGSRGLHKPQLKGLTARCCDVITIIIIAMTMFMVLSS